MRLPLELLIHRHAHVAPAAAREESERQIGELVLIAFRAVYQPEMDPHKHYFVPPSPRIAYKEIQAGILREGDVSFNGVLKVPVERAVYQAHWNEPWTDQELPAAYMRRYSFQHDQDTHRHIGGYMHENEEALVLFGNKAVEQFYTLGELLAFSNPELIEKTEPWMKPLLVSARCAEEYAALCEITGVPVSEGAARVMESAALENANAIYARIRNATDILAYRTAANELAPIAKRYPCIVLANGLPVPAYLERIEALDRHFRELSAGEH
jgi:hypothetical protein